MGNEGLFKKCQSTIVSVNSITETGFMSTTL